MGAKLSKSGDVVYVHEYTREDGTVVKAHYRSKAGHRNPDKPVMKPLKEYKTALEKEIDEYMTRDAQARRGINQTEDNQVDTELKQEPIDSQTKRELKDKEVSTAPLYPSNGRLTGEVEISHEIPAVNIQPYTKPSIQAKPIEKPYTGREMNMKNIELPEWEPIKNIIPPTSEIEGRKRMQEQTTGEKIGRGLEQLKDKALEYAKKGLNKSLYRMITSNPVYEVQKNAIKSESGSKAVALRYPNAAKYYRISSTHGKSILNGVDKDNYIFTVERVQDEELKNHILSTMQSNGVNRKTMVVQPKEDARLTRAVKYSSTIINALKKYPDNRITNVNFAGEPDLYKTLGHTHIYRPHKDKDGNVIVNIVDYYDFADTNARTFNSAIVKNAYRQQEEGELTNYVLLIQLKYTPEEWKTIAAK